jgi:urease accessory protein
LIDDRVIPAADRRTAAGIGRHARLELRFAWRRGRTILAEAYAEPPFRVGRSFPEGAGLHMIMVSSAPGVFCGDCLEQVIRIESGARVRLTSQSALQVHPSPGAHAAPAQLARAAALPEPSAATLRARYIVAEDGELTCHWDPLIPFAGSRLDQRFELRLAAGSRLHWSDAFMAGREARGERWRFSSLSHELGVWRGDTLGYLERFRIEPADRPVAFPWIAADWCYFGTTIVSDGGLDPPAAERLHDELAEVDGVRAAVDAVDRNLLLVRLMASEGVPFHAARTLTSVRLRA